MATNDQTATSEPKKAIKILKLCYHHERPKILFDLPRELRDAIWSLALIEPTLYDKRHQVGCAFHQHDAAYQIPPAIVHEEHYNPGRIPFGISKREREKCKKLCLRRHSFGLMKGVNKQVHREVSEIFWQNNMPTFLYRQSMTATLNNVPESGLRQIRRLSLWQHNDMDNGWYNNTQKWWAVEDLMKHFRKMSNLEHLELPAEVMSSSHIQEIIETLPISKLCMWTLRQVQLTNGNDFVPVHLAIGTQVGFEPPKSPYDLTRNIRLRELRDSLMELCVDTAGWGGRRGHDDYAVEILADKQPGQPKDRPYVFEAPLKKRWRDRNGVEPIQTFYAWGLPIYSAATRSIRARNAMKKEALAKLVKKPTRQPVWESAYEDDFVVTGTKATGREHTSASRKTLDMKKLLTERQNHLKNVAKAEADVAKKQNLASLKAREKGQKEATSEKKAAAKRVGRGSS